MEGVLESAAQPQASALTQGLPLARLERTVSAVKFRCELMCLSTVPI